MKELVLVLVGGAFGTGVRYGCGQLALKWGLPGFYSTAFVNMVGAFLIGYCAVALKNHGAGLQALMMVGLFGGLTTFSSLTLETINLVQEGQPVRAALYLGAQVLLGLLLTALGIFLAGRGISAG